MVFAGPVLYFAFTSIEIGKLFPHVFFYFSGTALLKFTLIPFLRLQMKTRKNITEPHASVHLKNGQNAKNTYENKKDV